MRLVIEAETSRPTVKTPSSWIFDQELEGYMSVENLEAAADGRFDELGDGRAAVRPAVRAGGARRQGAAALATPSCVDLGGLGVSVPRCLESLSLRNFDVYS